MLKSLYSSIARQEDNIKSFCCFYLNYWLNKQRKEKLINVNVDAWQVIEKLWGTLKNSSVSCKRKYYDEPWDDMKKCVEFMVYCVNRDELQKHCENPSDVGFKSMYCNNFNIYTKHYYDQFTKKVTCLRDTNKDIHYNWKFSDTCTLHNMAKTFPKYDKSRQKIVDDTSRLPINKCEDPGDSRTINCYMLDGVPVTLEELPTIDVIPLKY
ncbi:variable surface protein Vir3, truncated, putative, partial [Plasmodium vivax]